MSLRDTSFHRPRGPSRVARDPESPPFELDDPSLELRLACNIWATSTCAPRVVDSRSAAVSTTSRRRERNFRAFATTSRAAAPASTAPRVALSKRSP